MQNKNLHVCGIGHALVDIEYTLDESQFESLGLKKGTMTLVSAEEQQAMIQKIAHHAPHRSSGGSAANTIIAIGQFGGRAAYKTILGDDAFGKFYASEFQELGIHLEAESIPGALTGTCLVLITPDAERTMLTNLGVNSTYNRDHLVEQTIAGSEWLYAEGYRLTEPGGAEAVKEAIEIARRNNTKIAFTFSDTFVVNVFRDRVQEITEFADLIFCNESEAMAFTEATDKLEAFKALQAQFPNIVMTLGANGALIKYAGNIHEIPAYQTRAIDTTGAGDMFAAGFLYGITHQYSTEKAGHLASYASSRIVAQYGARLKESPVELRNSILASIKD
jgi:sugar/nucleoside kinase (ribokinase family)